jgi:hypothetical protein
MILLAVLLRLVVVVAIRIGVKNNSFYGIPLVCNRYSIGREYR